MLKSTANRRIAILLGVPITVVVVVFLLFYPFVPDYVSYRSDRGTLSTSLPASNPESKREWIERDGTLYIRSQKISYALVLVTGVNRDTWSEQDLVRFRSEFEAAATRR